MQPVLEASPRIDLIIRIASLYGACVVFMTYGSLGIGPIESFGPNT
jgi:hypothetical protein